MNDLVFIPGRLTITAIDFDVTSTGMPLLGIPQTGVRAQDIATTVTFIHLIDHVSSGVSLNHVVDATPYGSYPSSGLMAGTFPYKVPAGGVYLWVELDSGDDPGNVTAGQLTITTRRRSHVGYVGS